MISEEKFHLVLTLIVPKVIELICENHNVNEIEATKEFYESEVYALLEREETWIWHFSPLTLFHMFDEEKKTGSFVIPEET